MTQDRDLLKPVSHTEVVFITDKPKLPSLDGRDIDPSAKCRVLLRRRDNGKMEKELKAIYFGSEKPGVYTFKDINTTNFFRLAREAIDKRAVSLLNEPNPSLLKND